MAKAAISLIVSEYDKKYKGNFGERIYCLRILEDSTGGFAVQARYDESLYCYEDITKIILAFELSSYLTIDTNEAGIPTPTIKVF